jgi:tetratricopeptide (TPR) repeat protein
MSLIGDSLSLYRSLDDGQGIADALFRLGDAWYWSGDHDRAELLCAESLALREALGERRERIDPLSVLARIAMRRREYQRSLVLYEEALELARGEEPDRLLPDVLLEAGVLLCRLGEAERAMALQRESLGIYQHRGNRIGIAACLAALAETLAGTGQAEQAARLLGAAEALREVVGQAVPPVYRRTSERVASAARAALGERSFAAAWAAGRTLAAEDAIAEALGEH